MTDEEALKCFEDDCWRCRQRKSCGRLEKAGGSPCRNINAISALRERIERQNPQPLTLADVDKMNFDKVWMSYGDGTDDGEWGIVIFGRLYSIDVLEGAGLQDMLDDLMCGESLDRPSGQYVVYRTKPEPPEEVQT